MFFIDALGQKAISRVTISKTTAKALIKVLSSNLTSLEKELASQIELKVQGNDTAQPKSYIG